MPTIWIRCGSLITGDGTSPLPDMAVGISDGVITRVVPWVALAGTDLDQVVDASAHTVSPGFIDAHVHLLFTCDVDHTVTRRAVEQSSPAQLALTGARSAAECLLGGVTTVRDCGDRDFITLDLRDAVARGTLPGPRILAAGPPVTTTAGHLYWCGNAADSLDELRRTTRNSCARGVDVVKVMASGGNMTHGSNGRMPQFTTEEVALVVSEAHRLGRRVAAHAQNTESIRRVVAAGVDTVEHCGWHSVTGEEEIDLDTVAAMARQGTWAVLTFAGIARLLLPEFAAEESAARDAARDISPSGGDLVKDFAWARTLREAGVPMVLASDAGVRFTPFRRFDESINCGVVALGITVSQAVGLATRQAALALGIDDEVGSVDVGKRADLVVLDGLTDDGSTRIGVVRQVWRDGVLVVDQDRILVAGPADAA